MNWGREEDTICNHLSNPPLQHNLALHHGETHQPVPRLHPHLPLKHTVAAAWGRAWSCSTLANTSHCHLLSRAALPEPAAPCEVTSLQIQNMERESSSLHVDSPSAYSGWVYYLPLLDFRQRPLCQEIWILRKKLRLLSLSSFQLYLPEPKGFSISSSIETFLISYSLFPPSWLKIITLSQASKFYSWYTDGSFLEFGKHFSLAAKHWFEDSLTFHITILTRNPQLSQDSLFWVVSSFPWIDRFNARTAW